MVWKFTVPELPVVIVQLPFDVKSILFERLNELQEIDFSWFPTFVGGRLSEAQQQEFKAELKNRFANFESLFE
ncbi:hypothetical protein [Anatilimnocola floriformis]|uniref:hypothetical protein n=1 Tax=Anatilimnocola floriformis TaxID=2948575 RepID=UPI0020C2C6AE|nr:hypothetical protein [Anatilimnocola floriformis]